MSSLAVYYIVFGTIVAIFIGWLVVWEIRATRKERELWRIREEKHQEFLRSLLRTNQEQAMLDKFVSEVEDFLKEVQ